MNSGQGARTGSLLGLRGTAAVGAFGTGKDATRGEDQDVAVGELLFELTGQALLDLVKAGEERDGNEDDDGFFAVADFDLEEVERQVLAVVIIEMRFKRIGGSMSFADLIDSSA